MAPFTSYFDESDTSRAGVVAGCTIAVNQLEHFGREWSRLLHDYGLSYFHMKDYAHSKEEFTLWGGDDARRKEFLKRLIGIIRRRANISIGVVVDRQEYNHYVCTPDRRRFFKNIYTTASYMCLFFNGRWADKYAYGDPIAYVFDEGNPKRSDFESAYYESKNIPELEQRYRLGSLSFADDKAVPPLQAADFIAYEISKFWTDHRSQSERAPRLSLMSAMDTICNDWRIVTKEMLIAIAADAHVP